VEISVDLLLNRVEDRLAPVPVKYVHRAPVLADPEAVSLLAALLARAARPVVIAGSGVYWDDAAKALGALATASGAPVFMNGEGRGALPSDHPGAFAHARGFALARADVVLVLGAPLDFRLGYGRPPTFAEDARVAMIDADPTELGRNRPLELGLQAHIGAWSPPRRSSIPVPSAASASAPRSPSRPSSCTRRRAYPSSRATGPSA
jgi:acetolactate synthase-1/2/3 large subunit